MNATLITQLIGLLTPAVVYLLVHQKAPTWLKTGTMLLLTAVGTLIHAATDASGHIHFTQALVVSWIGSTVTAIASYYGVWQHTPLGGMLGSFGLGTPSSEPLLIPDVAPSPLPSGSDPTSLTPPPYTPPVASPTDPVSLPMTTIPPSGTFSGGTANSGQADITQWPVDQLDALSRFAHANTDGVRAVYTTPADVVPDHGVNTPDETQH